MNPEWTQIKKNPLTGLWLSAAVAGLGLVFIFQKQDVLGVLCACQVGENWHFVVNKTLRLILNDLLLLWIIHLWFNSPSVTRLALWLQLIDTLILLPIYLILKLQLEGTSEISSPLLSQLHRFIINPLIMILIFPAVYFQRNFIKK